ncbi:hypothetical protein KFE25_010255 [Diacronema lutheri]|uniref:DNA primase n=1 Tax=Diacronema lutheri TaxID=2081491 RepID=A0A8J6C7W7_DIALT|nr:hypothetical protein KFE25_010255 [Diacronema lutheri]
MGENFSPELLRTYYKTVFPAELMCRWLGYGTSTAASAQQRLLRRREFSFTTGDDVYIRYLSYNDAKAFRKDLVDKLPYKIDIGAAFSAPPSEKKKFTVFQPVQRELIFDIDLTDYDFLQVDASKVETCDACWPIMAVAVKTMDRMLRHDFGFEHLLWVYSGRRGIHCWVCDERARNLTNEGRSAIADYMSLTLKDGRMAVRVPLHPTLASIHREVLLPFFERTVLSNEGMGLLESEAGWGVVLGMLGDDALAASLSDEYARRASGAERWEALKRALERNKLSRLALELEFTLSYPRLDVNVSKGMNHLLKSPWCAHPKTGRVCVVFDPQTVDDFQPGLVPTLGEVMSQIDEYDDQQAALGADAVEAARATDVLHKTSLRAPAELFAKFVRGLEAAARSTAHAEAARGAQAVQW